MDYNGSVIQSLTFTFDCIKPYPDECLPWGLSVCRWYGNGLKNGGRRDQLLHDKNSQNTMAGDVMSNHASDLPRPAFLDVPKCMYDGEMFLHFFVLFIGKN